MRDVLRRVREAANDFIIARSVPFHKFPRARKSCGGRSDERKRFKARKNSKNCGCFFGTNQYNKWQRGLRLWVRERSGVFYISFTL